MGDEIAKELIAGIALGIILVIPVWVIHKKAGLNPVLSLLLFIPWIGLLIVYLVLAFSEWNSAKETLSRNG